MLDIIIKTNGVCNIISALCILDIIEIEKMYYLQMCFYYDNNYDDNIREHKRFQRFLAYLLLLSGVIKIYNNYFLVTSLYGFESAFCFNEVLHNSLTEKGLLSSVFSMFLCIFLILN